MYFWLNYSDKNNYVESIPFAVKNTDRLFFEPSEIHAFFISSAFFNLVSVFPNFFMKRASNVA